MRGPFGQGEDEAGRFRQPGTEQGMGEIGLGVRQG